MQWTKGREAEGSLSQGETCVRQDILGASFLLSAELHPPSNSSAEVPTSRISRWDLIWKQSPFRCK